MKAKYKMAVLSMICALGMIIIAVVTMRSILDDGAAFHEMNEVDTPRLEALLRMQMGIQNIAKRNYEILSKDGLKEAEEKRELQLLQPLVQTAHDDVLTAIQAYKKLPIESEEGRTLWEQFERDWNVWFQFEQDNRRQLDVALSNLAKTDFQPLYQTVQMSIQARRDNTPILLGELDSLVKQQEKIVSEIVNEEIQEAKRDEIIMLIVFLISIIALGWYSLSMIRSAVTPFSADAGQGDGE
ncbi:MAG: MCP four helix bundle domain-containing protein [Azoarcus sp.]|jgi:hypothetical protein|nr:MCP four helix bundle domain-containing protein [Azoarcus sp.]